MPDAERTDVQPTDDGRYVVIRGRRWRATDPSIPDDAAARLRSELSRARADVGAALRAQDADRERGARARVQVAKTALGERGTPWWEQTPAQRQERWEHGLRELDGLDGGPQPGRAP